MKHLLCYNTYPYNVTGNKIPIRTRSTGTVHTSANAYLTSVVISLPLSVMGWWRNDVIVAMAIPALHRSVAQCNQLIPPFISPNSDESGKQSLYPDGDLDCHQNLTVCSVAHCQASLIISCKSIQKFLCKVATGRQTNNDDYISSLADVIKNSIFILHE